MFLIRSKPQLLLRGKSLSIGFDNRCTILKAELKKTAPSSIQKLSKSLKKVNFNQLKANLISSVADDIMRINDNVITTPVTPATALKKGKHYSDQYCQK